jgi:putative ABC transport system permease protein
MEIVGIVGSIRSISLRKPEEEEIYCPWSQRNIAYVQIVARTRGRPELSASDVRAAVLRLDAQLPIIRQTTMDNAIDDSLGQNRMLIVLVGLFAGLAFVLAAVGIYSVVAYTVTQRTSEIGIRIIMGAKKRDVVWLVMTQGLRPVGLGCVLGLALTFWGKNLIASQVFGVSPLDPTILSLSVLAVVLAATAACWLPATRATRVDPMQAIRTE